MKTRGAPKGPIGKFITVDIATIAIALALAFVIYFNELRRENLSIYTTLFLPIIVVRISSLFYFRLYDFRRYLTKFDIIYFTFWASVLAHVIEILAILYIGAFQETGTMQVFGPTPGVNDTQVVNATHVVSATQGFNPAKRVNYIPDVNSHQISRYILLLNFLLSWWISCAWRLLYLTRRRKWAYDKTRLLIVGAGVLGESVKDDIKQYSRLGHEVIGLIDDNIESPGPDTPILGRMSHIGSLVEEHQIDEIIVTSQAANRQELLGILSTCQDTGCIVRFLPELYEVIIGQVEIGQVAGIPLITVESETTDDLMLFGKRAFDLVFGTIFLLLLSPVFPIISLLIKYNSKGDVLYRQTRIGKEGKPFRIYKFRTMFINAETDTGPVKSWDDDPRVTSIGRVLRRWRLDETPQLFNVLKGDMSLVGPRPERPHFVEKYKSEILSYKIRESVRPGVTGLAQIHGFYNSPVEHKLRYDLAYINNMSILLDLKILFNTIRVVVSEKGVSDLTGG